MTRKPALYIILSAGLLLPVGIDVASGAMTWPRAAVIGSVLLSFLWCSWPAYRSAFLRQAALTITLLVMANAVLTPATSSDAGPQIVRPNASERFEIAEPGLAGLPQGLQAYSTNAHGHRTNRPIDYDRKDANTLRVAAFGGSTTAGVLLDDRKTWPTVLGSLLEAALHRPVEVVNAGAAGTRAPHHLAAFRQSERYRPDIAIFMLGINDWNRQVVHDNDKAGALLDAVEAWRFSESVLWKAARAAAETADRWLSGPLSSDEIGAPGQWYESMMRHAAQRPRIRYRPTDVSPQYASAVQEIIAECRRRGIPCLFLDQPTAYGPRFEAEQRLWMNPPFADFSVAADDLRAIATLYNDWLAAAVGRTGLSFCPIADRLPPTTEVFFDDCHFNENGARLVAKLVAACLLEGSLAHAAVAL